MEDVLREYLGLIIERMTREADIDDGTRVPHGSRKHVKDLERRIANMTNWRDRQKRGTESRANYARLINRLKAELASARHAAEKKKAKRK